jgi:pilus assembly protein CpaC
LPGGRMIGYAVTVDASLDEVRAAIKAQAPGADVSVTGQPGGLAIGGRARSPREAAAVKAAAQQFLAEKDRLVFNVAIAGATQVNLQVRVAEVSRQVTKSFGVNWDVASNNGQVAIGLLTGRAPSSAFGKFIRDPSASQLSSIGAGYQHGSFSASALIDALQAEGLATVLAEPNLTASSGESASFLAGGEFPVPISQGLNQLSIEWKRFGISLDFSPTVLDDNRMSIRVRPEVSELSDNGSVVINSIRIPSIAVRRAETTVELASGQSFAIAGLFQNSSANSIQQYPWLGDIPVLGALFRSSSYKRSESELVIIVTPYVVQPVSDPAALRLPTDTVTMSSDLERVFLGRLSSAPTGGERPHLSGQAGFLLEDRK